MVSIIIPCYNVEAHVESAVLCALAQTYQQKEVICIDNGSSDDTWEKLNDLKGRFPELMISQEFRKGAPAARNRGLSISKGEWIQFLDADDRILPGKIAHQIGLIEEEVGAIPFIAGAAMKGDPVTDRWTPWYPDEMVWRGLLTNRLGNTCANLFHRSYLEEIEGWDESLKSSQEYDLMFRIMQIEDHILIDPIAENTLITSAREGAISSVDVEGNKHRFLALIARICVFMKEHQSKEYARLDQAFFDNMYKRIRLNGIKGHSNSGTFYSDILPADYFPTDRSYDPWWFRKVMGLFGFSIANRIQRLKNVLKS